ncbi:MAG: hypothetical protein AAFW89_04565 [Bacteroidota bacterium]
MLRLTVIFTLILSSTLCAQTSIPDPDYRGTPDFGARGIMDGNLIETNYRNHGELSRFGDSPFGIWPRGIGGRHIDGIGLMVVGRVLGEREKWGGLFPTDQDLKIPMVSLNYRDSGRRTSANDVNWNNQPLNGFLELNRFDVRTSRFERIPAISDDNSSWPDFWPDRLDNVDDPGWPGQWNGLFGRGVFNADLESFYVIDDMRNQGNHIDPETGRIFERRQEMLIDRAIFYPDGTDSTKGGMALQMEVRLLQWANILAEDSMFMLYRITNVGQTSYDSLFFTQGNDYGLGEDEFDDNGVFNPQLDIAYGFDSDGVGIGPNGEYDVGYTGFAFLDSPAQPFDGLDNDEDGIIDERRTRGSGAGILIEGQQNILDYVVQNYRDTSDFNRVFGPIETQPAYIAGYWWTGDENLNWETYNDVNENGQLDPGELLNDDTGLDGVGPNDLGYDGPDFGEGDGIPQDGERDFNELDIPESDQIGLSGFDLGTRPIYQSNILRDDLLIWQQVRDNLFGEIGKEPETLTQVEPFILFSSGPVELPAQTSDFFSLAWIFGEDLDDFLRNRIVVQNIYDANYNFAQPPFTPTLTAVPGDGQVTLSWDSVSLRSFDRFTQEFDFEGYKLFKGTDPLLTDARTITDVTGVPTLYEPIAQWDLINGIEGNIPYLDNQLAYNLGDDTGIEFFYVDDDVTNGITYYYALVAYDRGVIDSTDNRYEIDPQENTFNFGVDQFFNLRGSSINAQAVVPRTNPAGFVSSGTNDDLSQLTNGEGTGSMSIRIVNEEQLDFGDTYRVDFFDSPIGNENPLYFFTDSVMVTNMTKDSVVLQKSRFNTPVLPTVEGIIITLENEDNIVYDANRTGWFGGTEENPQYNTNPSLVDGTTTNWRLQISNAQGTLLPSGNRELSPDNYEITFTDTVNYLPPRFNSGSTGNYTRAPLNLISTNLSTGERTEMLLIDRNDNDLFDAGDDLVLSEGRGSAQRLRHRIRISLPPGEQSIPPANGETIRITNRKPFRTGDFFLFTTRPAIVEDSLAASQLDDIRVVPNPYLAYSPFEPRISLDIQGRSEREIQFINLPQTCTIRIFNIRGERIATINHDSSNSTDQGGSASWDLRSKDGLDIAFGVYVYHVEAPGIGEKTGKFAIIK